MEPALDGKKLKPKDRKVWTYNPNFCIGCGVCVPKCPTQAITLVHRGKDADIPESFSQTGQRMLSERKRDFSKLF